MRKILRSKFLRRLHNPYFTAFYLVPQFLLGVSFLYLLLLLAMMTIIALFMGGGLQHFDIKPLAFPAYLLACALTFRLIRMEHANFARWRRERFGWIMPCFIGLAGVAGLLIVLRPHLDVLLDR